MRRALVLATLVTAGCATTATGGTDNATGITTTPVGQTTTRVLTDAGNLNVTARSDMRISTNWVRAPADRVQAQLPGVYEALGITMSSRQDGGVMVFTNDDITANRRFAGERVSEYLNCGQTPMGTSMADASTVQIKMTTLVSGGAEGTELKTQLTGMAYSRTNSGTGAACVSTGRLEQRIAQMLTERTAS